MMDSNDNEPISVISSSVQTEEIRGGAFVNYGATVADEADVHVSTTTASVDTKVNPVFDNKFGAKTDDPNDDKRDTWGKKADFLLSVIGFAVDLANVWRFPYLCYRNGGGAFLIPYVIFLIFGGIPMLYMELALGQYHKTGAISVWKICPLFKGVGWAVVLISWYVAMYYNVIIAWAVYYLISSFTKTLPWTGCGHAWNTPYCYDSQVNETWLQVNGELVPLNASVGSTSAEEFFNRGVLGVHNSNGIDDIGSIKWQLLLCLIGVLLVVYFSIWKGVKTSGKVVWVTATLPYLVITILLVRGVTLPGSAAGIRYYLTPDFTRLQNAEVWIDAAIQIFYSIGAGFGVHIAYASYNKFNNNIYRDALFTSSVNCVTSFFSGFAIFAVLGYMSQKLNRPIDEVATDGPGLVFIVYPEALSTLPGAAVWSVLFYLMLITLGLDSSFGGMEAIITGLTDEFPTVFKKRREWLVAGIVGSVFLFALFNVTYGGLYVFTLQDKHFAGTSLLFVVTIEVIAVSWFYGLTNFSQDIKRMIGSTPGIWWRICWKFAAPLFLVFILLVSVILTGPLTLDDYIYPDWANVIGWCLTASSMIMVPLFAVYEISKANGETLQEKFLISITPVDERYLVEQGLDRQRLQANHWLSI